MTEGERAAGDAAQREYRAAELAEKAGITTRTLRFYRERKLLPPPRREGRIAWYNEHHLARLRSVSELLARGHTLGGIVDLFQAFESGRDAANPAELLGLEPESVAHFADEEPLHLTPEALADYFQGEVSAENLAAALDIGYVAVDGEEFVHVSRRLLEASAALVETGIPLSAVLATGRTLRAQAEAIAAEFTGLFRTHLLPKQLADADGLEALGNDHLNEILERLRPIARQVVEAELGLAMDRRIRLELADWLQQLQPNPTDPRGPDT